MRITRHQMFMQIAEAASRRSTCYRRSVGAVLVKANNVISIGYNGPKAGEAHCTGRTCPSSAQCIRAVHAEVNAIERAQQPLEGSSMYVTESPCFACAQMMALTARISSVYYLNEYRLTEGLVELLSHQIKVFRMTPGGYVIDYATGELCP